MTTIEVSPALTREEIMKRLASKQDDIARGWHICPDAYLGCVDAKNGEKFGARCSRCYVDCPGFKFNTRIQ